MSNNSNSLLKKTLIYGIGTFGSKVLTFLLVPLYSYYLNREEFGYFDLVITSINLVVPFVTLQISNSVFRWLFSAKEDFVEKSKVISNGLVFSGLNILLVIFISLILKIFHPFKHHFLITILCISSMFYPLMQQIARGLGKSKLFAFNGILYTIIYLIGNILLLVIFKLNVEALFYSTLLGYFLAGCFLFIKLKIWKFLDFKLVNLSFCKEMLDYSLPLVPNTISWWLINSANRYIILFFIGVGANGVFAMSNRFPVILVMINQIFTLAWQEAAIQHYEQDRNTEQYTRILDNLIRVQFSFVIILTLLSQFLVKELISEEFYESWVYMPILYLSVSFLSFSGFYGAFYLGAKKTTEIFTTTIYGGILNVILALILVKFWGLMGICIATMCGYFYLFLLRIRSIKKLLAIKFPIKTFIKYSCMVVIVLLIAYQQSVMYSLLGLIAVLLFLIFDNRYPIMQLLYSKKKMYNENEQNFRK